MSKEVRSRGACWTCRLRRKKCDELSPACSVCTSLAVPCFGYDKPTWADGGVRQKAKWEELQIIIRELASMRRKRRKQQAARNGRDANEVKKCDNACSETPIVQMEGTDPRTAELRTAITKISSLDLESLTVSESSYSTKAIISDVLAYDSQANLLMHYLDVVFPSQFPFYNPPASEGGRGWLLLIILRTRPLYHAALSMAAYHQKTQNCELVKLQTLDHLALDKLLSHHSLAIRELREHLEFFRQAECSESLQGNIEVLGCIVLLISLEVYLGDTQSWHIHLRAAQTLLPGLRKGCSRSAYPDEPYSPIHKKAHQFFTGAIAWFDILSAATTGVKPWAPVLCLDEAVGFIRLETVMGCENSVIVSIMKVACLDGRKSSSLETPITDVPKHVEGAARIENDLANILEQHSRALTKLAPSESPTRDSQSMSELLVGNEQPNDPAFVGAIARKASTSAVTRIFACAALVYLNVVMYGPSAEHPKIYGKVSQVITALEELHDSTALGILAWPLCIAGCMATGWQVDSFKRLSLQFGSVSDVKSGNLKRSSMIMEECWRMRGEGKPSSPYWKDAIESLDMKVLLI